MKTKTNLVNKRLGGFVLLVIISSAVGISPVFASPFAVQNANITNTNATSENLVSTAPIGAISVITDKTSYNDGDTVKVSGSTMNYIPSQAVEIIVKSPIGNIVTVDQLTLGSDSTFSTTLKATGSLWSAAGVYTVMAYFGSTDTAQTTFQFAGSSASTQGPTMPVDGTSLSVQYSITNGKVTDIKANVLSKSIIVSMNSTGDGVLTITLPRALVDSQNGGADAQWVVLNDGQQSTYTETTTTTARTLAIPFTYGTSEIEIIGTQIIPEFGPIAALVLAIAIISIIAVSAKTGLRFMPKY
jgi:predicted secreted protein with PEFG-CTERM motif